MPSFGWFICPFNSGGGGGGGGGGIHIMLHPNAFIT